MIGITRKLQVLTLSSFVLEIKMEKDTDYMLKELELKETTRAVIITFNKQLSDKVENGKNKQKRNNKED